MITNLHAETSNFIVILDFLNKLWSGELSSDHGSVSVSSSSGQLLKEFSDVLIEDDLA